jgi:CubicO group peptidase (beta-lactamase class C family)
VDLIRLIDSAAGNDTFSGVVRVDDANGLVHQAAHGLADRAHRIPTTVTTRFATASATKGLTALTVMSLVDQGLLALATSARSVLGPDLPLIDDAVTVGQLLSHRSGIGDYLDETQTSVDDYVMSVPVHTLCSAESYLAVLDGHPMAAAPGRTFAYCNGGYCVLAIIAERVSGVAFAELVQQRVCRPAGMTDTAFLRTDELPAETAVGYLREGDGLRTNVLHLPVLGSGDGGIFSTVSDVAALWRALFSGAIVPLPRLREMMRPHSDVPEQSARYGLGFWVHATRDTVVRLEGCDAGISFRSVHDHSTSRTHTVMSNTARGAWPVSAELDRALDL